MIIWGLRLYMYPIRSFDARQITSVSDDGITTFLSASMLILALRNINPEWMGQLVQEVSRSGHAASSDQFPNRRGQL